MHKVIKSFSRTVGKTLTSTAKDMLENVLPKYLVKEDEDIFPNNSKKVILEIGFGNGEHFANLINNNDDAVFIGIEPFRNGISSLLKQIADRDLNDRLKLFDDDANILLKKIKNKSLDEVYVLFSDPWPKKKHHKRRLINKEFLELMSLKIKNHGKLIIATDFDDYAENIFRVIKESQQFKMAAETLEACSKEPTGWFKTNYQKKAEVKGKGSYFFLLTNA